MFRKLVQSFSSAYSNASNSGFIQDFKDEITLPSNFLSDYPSGGNELSNDVFGFSDNFEDFSRSENAEFFGDKPRFSRFSSPSGSSPRSDEDEKYFRDPSVHKQDFPSPLYPTKPVRRVEPHLPSHFVPTVQTAAPTLRYSEPLRYRLKYC